MMKAVALSDRGKVRRLNQDTVFASESRIGILPNLLIVADGMGGHQAGDYCSRMLVTKILDTVRSFRAGEHVAIVRGAIENANRELYRESVSDPKLAGMGSTLVAAIVEDGMLYAFNVGDSRLYLIDRHMHQITKDHSFVEEMVAAGRMKRGSLDYKNNKNIITRAVGIEMSVDVDVFEIPLKKNEVILLCSDGLTNMLSDAEIESVLLDSGSLDDAAGKLIAAANDRGGTDNISVVLAALSGKEALE